VPVATLSLRGVRTRNRAALAALTAVLAAAPLSAIAATSSKPPLPKLSSSVLWATVDVCNTAAHPNTIGIRGSMPGTGDKHEAMYMEFVVEYQSSSGRWHYFKKGGLSGYVPVGGAGSKSRQDGQDFELAPNSATYMLRGVVLFQWRLDGHAVASTVRSTSAGHDPAAGSDPPGFSAASCTIQPNKRGSLEITPVTPRAARRSIRAASSSVHT
jgi:hypothetical protein